jgi:hypothetical protein
MSHPNAIYAGKSSKEIAAMITEKTQARAAEKRAKAARLLEEALAVAPHRYESERWARIHGRSTSKSDRLLRTAANAEARAVELERQVAKRRDRRANPSGGGVSLLGLALGAVLGAAALHFTMHRKPQETP